MRQERSVLAGGCFWGMQDLIRKRPGVISTRVGYSGGDVPNATYRKHGTHAEAIEIVFDPDRLSFRELLEFFFQIHDPTTRNRQGNDAGTSYRSAIFTTSDEQRRVADDTIADVNASGLWPGKVVTEVAPAGPFWEAEPEHQDYLERIPNGYTCHFVRPGWRSARTRQGTGFQSVVKDTVRRMLFEPARHEALLTAAWDAKRARLRSPPSSKTRKRRSARASGGRCILSTQATSRSSREVPLLRRVRRAVGAVVSARGRRRIAAHRAGRIDRPRPPGVSRATGYRRGGAFVLARRGRHPPRAMAARGLARRGRSRVSRDRRQHPQSHQRVAVGRARHHGRRAAHAEVDGRSTLARSLSSTTSSSSSARGIAASGHPATCGRRTCTAPSSSFSAPAMGSQATHTHCFAGPRCCRRIAALRCTTVAWRRFARPRDWRATPRTGRRVSASRGRDARTCSCSGATARLAW